jgi:enterochelin esterase-like enzyme
MLDVGRCSIVRRGADGRSILALPSPVAQYADRRCVSDVLEEEPMRSAAATTLIALACRPLSLPDAFDTPDAPDLAPQHGWTTPDAAVPRVQQLRFASAAAGTDVTFHVFVPELYDRDAALRLPVLYYLHGTGAGTTGIRPLTSMFSEAMRAGAMPPMLIVFPNGLERSLWVDAFDGAAPVETVVVRELVPLVDATFRTVAAPEGRVVEGFSMGGYGAARYGAVHHDVFGAFSVLAGGPLQPDLTDGPRSTDAARQALLDEVFGGDMANFYEASPWNQVERNAAALRDGRPIRMAIGDRDEMLVFKRAFHRRVAEFDVAHDWTEVAGVGHDAPGLIRGMGEGFWTFYRDAVAR